MSLMMKTYYNRIGEICHLIVKYSRLFSWSGLFSRSFPISWEQFYFQFDITINTVTALLLWTEIHKQWRTVINTHICTSFDFEREERSVCVWELEYFRICRNEEWLIISTNRKKLVTLRTRRCHADTLDIGVLLSIGDKIIKFPWYQQITCNPQTKTPDLLYLLPDGQ